MFSKNNKNKVEKKDDNIRDDVKKKNINQTEKATCEKKEQQIEDELESKDCAQQNENKKTKNQKCKQKDEKLEKIEELQETLDFEKKLVGNMKDEKYKLSNQADTLRNRLERVSSEYENYRKRTAKEKEALYNDACEDVLKNVFPVIDNLERAVDIQGKSEDIKKGVEMTLKQLKDSFCKLGIEEIPTDGEFDPNFHNAVMHVEDDKYNEKQITDVLQKGYKKGNKVLRYSMVKVAN